MILFVLNLIPGLSLRVSAENEEVGIDDDQLGEFAYDYVELQRHTSDVLAGSAEVPTPNAGRAGSSKSSEGPEKMV